MAKLIQAAHLQIYQEKHGFAEWSLPWLQLGQANRKGEKLSVAEHRAEAAEEQAENLRESKLSMTSE